jgi:glutathione peroxidase
MSIYDFKLKNSIGEVIDFKTFKGKTILIINVASKCGFSIQYKGLEKLHQDYKESGLVVLGFPCNQFKNQEFENDQEIKDFCTLKYDVTFEIFSRIDVKGENQTPLYKFLTEGFP